MSHYPEPQPGPGDFGQQPGGTPYPQQGPPGWGNPSGGHPQSGGYPQPGGYPQSGGYPSGEMAPYDPAQPPQTGGWQAMPGQAPAPQGGPPVATIGDITVTQTEIITPAGTCPLRGATWSINDMSHVEEKIAPWAVIIAILGFFFICVFSLFFLLVKETSASGSVQVTVRNGNFFHSTQIPAHSRPQVQHLHQQFNYIRSLSMM